MARSKTDRADLASTPGPSPATVGPPVTSLSAALAELAERIAVLAADPQRPLLFPSLDSMAPDIVADSAFGGIATRLSLDATDLGLLVCAVAPSLDARFGSLFADLDADRRRAPRVDVAAALAGGNLWDPAVRRSLGPTGALSRAHLWTVSGSTLLPDSTLVADEQVVAHLLGERRRDPALDPCAATVMTVDLPEVEQVSTLLFSGFWTIWLHDPSGHLGISIGATAYAALGTEVVALDLHHLPSGTTLADILPSAIREATLRQGGVVIGGVQLERDREALNTIGDPVCPIVLVGQEAWDPIRSSSRPALIDVAPISQAVRRNLWERTAAALEVPLDDFELDGLSTLRLGPGQIAVAGEAALPLALAARAALGEPHLRTAALTNGAGRLERLATHIVPRATFDDLVLPDDLMEELRAIPGWMRTRHRVRAEWGMDRGARSSRGISCLFAGPSGTGKTLAAEVVAHSLGVDLYVIDLSQIVDKYIGETEKNLDRVFNEAQDVNGVLLFDEADALFGKRTDVKSSHDRNANLEVAYLLQRMERYDGVAVLTTNLRNNIDDAFTRRLDIVCAFLEPDAASRRALWQRHLPPTVPLADDVDLELLAEHLPVTGGVIRNITIAAAHAAAIEGNAVSMHHLVVAASREYRKHGRLFGASPLVSRLQAVSADVRP